MPLTPQPWLGRQEGLSSPDALSGQAGCKPGCRAGGCRGHLARSPGGARLSPPHCLPAAVHLARLPAAASSSSSCRCCGEIHGEEPAGACVRGEERGQSRCTRGAERREAERSAGDSRRAGAGTRPLQAAPSAPGAGSAEPAAPIQDGSRELGGHGTRALPGWAQHVCIHVATPLSPDKDTWVSISPACLQRWPSAPWGPAQERHLGPLRGLTLMTYTQVQHFPFQSRRAP